MNSWVHVHQNKFRTLQSEHSMIDLGTVPAQLFIFVSLSVAWFIIHLKLDEIDLQFCSYFKERNDFKKLTFLLHFLEY